MGLATLLLGCTAASARTLVYCAEGSPENFTPALNTTGTSLDAARPVFDQLIEFERGSVDLKPGLAESWTVSPDGKTVTFKLRKGVKFGAIKDFKPTREFNADDVLFSFERQFDEHNPYSKVSGGKYDYYSDMDMPKLLTGIAKTDDYTVVMTLSEPNVAILANLAMDFATIHSKEYADALLKKGKPEQFDQVPVGTGPFTFSSYQKDAVIRFKANPSYWGGKPAIDDLVYAITPDPTARVSKIKTGECQVSPFPRPADVPELQKDADINVMSQPGLNIGYLAFNAQKPPFDKLAVRQAASLAIDRKAILAQVYGPAGQMAKNLIPPTMWAYNDGVTDYGFDPDKAKQMLKDAGVATPLDIDLWYMPVQRPYNPDGKRMAEMMQADLAKVGLNAKLVTYEWGEYRKRIQNGEATAALFGWTGDNGDPDNFFFFLGCIGDKPAASNIGKWCDAKFNADLAEARQVTDQSKRTAIYGEMQTIQHDQEPVLNIAHSLVYEPVRKEVVGFKMSPLSRQQFDGVDLK